MKTRLLLAVIGLLAGSLTALSPAGAGVVVLDNRTVDKVGFTIRYPDGKESRHTLVPGDLTPIAVTGPVGITFDTDGQPNRCLLQANSIYCFVSRQKKLDLFELALPTIEGAAPEEKPGQNRTPPAAPDSVYTVPVMILADDEEPTVRAVWEKRLRNRLASASEIFERHCCVRFQVVAVDTWVSDKSIHDFNRSVAEFERKVDPTPARLAIGFTGRYQWVRGESHVGGIRGPLRPHVLIREALRQVSEPERLEVLVHELGHFLGAVHAPDETSVMRPTLGDQRARARSFRIGFDASNTLAMYLLGEELRTRPIFSLYQLSPDTKVPLRRAYALLAKALPGDPAAPKFMALLDLPSQQGAMKHARQDSNLQPAD